MSNKCCSKTNKKYVIGGIIAVFTVLIAVLLAVLLPIMKANSELKGMFDDLMAMNDPVIIVTDMKSDSNFSNARGEIKIEDDNSTEILINDILALSDKLDYDGKESSGAWDIRVKIYDKERSVELYLAYGKIYYVKNNVKYVFVPSDPESESAYKILYKNFSAFVK